MASEQFAELVRSHADDEKDVPQGALRHVPASVNRNWDCTPIGMLHHVMTADDPYDIEASAFERLDYLRSRHGRDSARHKAGSYQRSGDVECQSQLIGWPNHIEQRFKRGAQVGDCLFLRRPIANRADARAELGRGAPDAVLVLLDDVGHVNVTSHSIEYRM
jgi:hypothetical protein